MVSFLKVGFVTQDASGSYELGPLALQEDPMPVIAEYHEIGRIFDVWAPRHAKSLASLLQYMPDMLRQHHSDSAP